ncbi:type I-E CRISPR-associated protein Cas6/Cse3/CasE [Streptomyces sp. NPDC101455]|uniref:type I-E CRISPR-associated protein Cas6/Cse3/CasE n=1 Tax=Streptomyces sp. NPDC101455 TaxID=3366142 RepID=UPI0038024E55
MTTPSLLPETRTTVTVWRSRLDLSATTRRDAHNVNRLHGMVLSGIPHPPDTNRPAHVLFATTHTPQQRTRAMPAQAGSPERVLVQSLERPDWQQLLEAGQVTDTKVTVVQQTYTTGHRIAVRIIANPTYRDLATRQRTALTDATDCAAWLQRRLSDGGIEVIQHHVSVGAPLVLIGHKGNHRITVVSRELQAHGVVRDASRLHQILTEGLGPAKPYGCGLLLARPLQ